MTSSIFRRGRRWRLAPAVALTALLALTGCASTEDEPNPASSRPAGLLPAAEGTTKYPLTLKTWAGESTLQKRPERIAVIGMSPNLDALQSLKVTPVYTLTEDPVVGWRDKAWAQKIEKVDTATRRDDTPFEGIAAAKPDLIIAVGAVVDEAEFKKLADIAPVLETEKEEEISWQDRQRLVGTTLDLAAAAGTLVTSAEQAIAAAAKAHPQFAGKTITIANDYGPQHGLSYYTVAGSITEGVMTNLGFTPNPNAKKFVDEDVVSDENLGLLDADLLVVVYASEAFRKTREAKPLFKALKPVTEGRYVALTLVEKDPTKVTNATGQQVDNVTWMLRMGASATSLPWGVKVIADQWLAGAKLS
ncbi:iron-siderophore ABC transporter substrate-binding protein [Actinomadura craniellae]|uniref:Iron-siderophore ABC transporter substrate-binding protein n=1 Tax=Actinomadura craniellae TaxID=2231787 RepID=A0A365HCA9_9ACTN|nr:ABC transporter substrate-binding protein [Actinomadura craniellae]RAY16745.1 iron-siderophore ABC transporter substrate-binding protein [Actinomadura craniellae]